MAEQIGNTMNKTRTEFNLFDGKEGVRYLYNKRIKILSEKMDRKQKANSTNIREKLDTTHDDIYISKTDGKSCLLCGVIFSSVEEQRSHFKLDWHKYNVKQRLLLRDPVREDIFEEIISGDLSSISGSESDEEALTISDSENIPLMTLSLLPNERKIDKEESMLDRSNPKVYFTNDTGICMSVYREVVYGMKEELTCEEIESRIHRLSEKMSWLILMTGGGHFAGAIFSGNDVIVSKTFHRYTVRAKRGTAQGMKDSKQGGHAPKSAGASLRRYNEAALVQDIQNLLESWSDQIEKCSSIFMRVPNSYKWIFFSGKKPLFEKDDSRIRAIPFATRRPTFKELKNVQKKLSTILINENYLQEIKEKTNKDVEKTTYIANKAQQSTRKYPVEVNTTDKDVETEVDQSQLKHVNSRAKKNTKDKKLAKKENQKNKTEQRENEVVPEVWIEIFEAIKDGNAEKTANIMKTFLKDKQECCSTPCEDQNKDYQNNTEPQCSEALNNEKHSEEDMINQMFESYGDTILHLASRLGNSDIVKILLEAGANPTIKAEGRVPYNVAKDKETRNTFRRFMAAYPEKYDYNEARIPSALTAEMEEKERQKTTEKKKAQSKARKQRLKEKKAEEKLKEEENLRKEKEENEKKWFQNLSDREKRAVAAERRLGNICFNCGRSLQGLVPFERHSNKYCTTECVQKHRKIMETAVK